MKEKTFKVTFQYSDEGLAFIAEQNGLSIEQLTDEKLAEFILFDLKEDEFSAVSVVSGLTQG